MRENHLIGCISAALAFAALVALPASAQTAQTATPTAEPTVSIPFAGISADLSAIRGELDAATARALQLEDEITALDADNRALDERLAVTAIRMVEQRAAVEAAETRLAEARERFRARLVAVYKRGSFDPFSMLLSSDTLTELVSRAALLTRIAEADSQVVSDLNVAAADALYQEAALADLERQDQALRQTQEVRRSALAAALKEQEVLVAQLTVEAREALLQARRITAETRQQWRASSIPADVDIPRAEATVDSHPGDRYLISAYMPREYRSTGQTYRAVCSWYGPGFDGRGTASGQIFNERDLTCASRTLPFGTILALTRGNNRVIVYVNDRGPYIAGRDLDLSKAAAAALGFGGVATVEVEIVTAVQ